MHILQVIPGLESGGVETGTIDLAKELVRQGHKAVVISNGGKLTKDLTATGGIHYTLPVHEKSPITAFNMIGKIREVIKQEEIDLVHARSRVPAFSAYFAARQCNVPFITTCHGYYSRHLFSRVMAWGKFVIVASNVIARHMIKDFGVPYEKIRLIPRGVDLEKFPYNAQDEANKKKRGYSIGIIGRITPIKGHVYFIRAISKVVRLLPNIKVYIIGDAPPSKPKYRQELEILVRRLSLSKYVHFLGQRHDIPQQLKKLDLLVMPSVGEEAFGRAIIEAQAIGVPVIATRVGGIVDIIKDGENGILVPPRDWSSLSDAIIGILKNGEFKDRLSKMGRANVEKNFSLSQMYEKTIKVYNETLSSCRIVVIKWSALGDVILSLPALKAIRQHSPRARIVMVTCKSGREIINRYNYVNEFIIYQGRKGTGGFKELFDISAELRRASVDMVIDLQNNKKSHMLSYLSLAPRRIGYKSGKLDFFLTDAIEGAKIQMRPIAHQFMLLRHIGIETEPALLKLELSSKDQDYAESVLKDAWIGKGQALVGVNCGASLKWDTKRWPVEKIARLCDLLAKNKIRVVLTGTKEDKNQAQRIIGLTRAKPIDITGQTTIMQLAAVIRYCSVFISADSAPIHLAASLGVPFVALFGPTDPKRHLEPSDNFRVIYNQLRCSPCYKPRCAKPICMNRITEEDVSEAVLDLLERKKEF